MSATQLAAGKGTGLGREEMAAGLPRPTCLCDGQAEQPWVGQTLLRPLSYALSAPSHF